MFKPIAILLFLSFFIFAATCEKQEQMSEGSEQGNSSDYISEVIDPHYNEEDSSPDETPAFVDGQEEASENESEGVPEGE